MLARRLTLLALLGSLWGVAGCFIGFDESKLRGPVSVDGGVAGDPGAAPAPSDAGGSPGADAGGGGDLGALGPLCDDFSAYSTGDSLPWWNEGKGTWRVVASGSSKALGQLDTSMSRHDLFIAWHMGSNAADATVQATINAPDSGNDNCVLARVTDARNFYKLCVHTDRGQQQNQRPQTVWDLEVMTAGTATRLSNGSSDGVSGMHQLALKVQGNTLTPVVDTVAQTGVTDSAHPNGAAGVATEASGVFTRVCITPP